MSPSDPPHLRAVEGGASAEHRSQGEPALQPAPAEPAPRRGGRLAWLLGAALLVCLAGWLWQARDAARLETRLAATEAALGAAEVRIAGLEGYLGSVRERFATLQETLQGELDALGALLAAEPGEAAAQPVAPAEDPAAGSF